MPTYTYQVMTDDGSEGDIIEVVHSMHDAPLKVHPETGAPVQRVLLHPPAIGGAWSEHKDPLSKGNLESHGFSRYERGDNDSWTRTAGDGQL